MNEDHPVEATNDHDVRDMRRSINDYFDEIKRRKKERSLRNCIKRFRYAFREAKALRAPQIDEREILTFLMGRNVDELNFIIKMSKGVRSIKNDHGSDGSNCFFI